MAVIKGKDGTVAVGSANVANVTSWSCTQEADVLETSAMGTGGAKTFVGSMTSWSGTVECFLDTTAQHTALAVGSEVAITLDTDGSGSAGSVYSGTVVVTSAATTVGAADIVTVSFDYQGAGTLTIA
jgi:hypothetical protein